MLYYFKKTFIRQHTNTLLSDHLNLLSVNTIIGKYGIRLENLIVVVPHVETEYGKFLQFETLTLFPFDMKLIDLDMFTEDEKGWLNRYHNKVFRNLSPKLSREDNQWLLEKTKEVE